VKVQFREMLISDVINGWRNNGEGLAINCQLGAKKKRSTLRICVTLWCSWMERFSCYYPHASLSVPYYCGKILTAAKDTDYHPHTHPLGIFLEPAFTSS
jgi:hypothetical protein